MTGVDASQAGLGDEDASRGSTSSVGVWRGIRFRPDHPARLGEKSASSVSFRSFWEILPFGGWRGRLVDDVKSFEEAVDLR